MPYLDGYDIAGVNGSGAAATATKNGALSIVKLSEGITFDDPYAVSFTAAVRAAGDLLGGYHYARTANPATGDAKHFVARARACGWRAGDTSWLDFEPYNQPTDPATWPGWVVAFLEFVDGNLPGTSCGIYLNDYFANKLLAYASAAQRDRIRRSPLWKAGVNNAYVSSPDQGPGDLHGWAVCTLFQWWGTTLDRDRFYGDASTWRALGLGGTTDVSLTDAEIKRIFTLDAVPSPSGDPANPTWQFVSYLKEILLAAQRANSNASQAVAGVAGISGKLDVLTKSVADLVAKTPTLDPAALSAAVEKAVADFVSGYKLELAAATAPTPAGLVLPMGLDDTEHRAAIAELEEHAAAQERTVDATDPQIGQHSAGDSMRSGVAKRLAEPTSSPTEGDQ